VQVVIPFSPDELDDVPAGFDFIVADAVDDWPEAAMDAEFYVPSYRFSQRVFDLIPTLPRLRVVQTLTAGYEHVAPLVADGVTLCNAAGVHDAATSELAVGLMISAQRRLPELTRAQDRQLWDQQMSSSLADQRVLIVGAGNISAATRRRLAGFECTVTTVARSARAGVHSVADLPSLLPNAGIVVLTVPLTDETAGMVDAGFLALMPDGALLVNVARGGVVVTDDLVREVQNGRLRAALDVTDPEPLPPGHPLWSCPGVILTPHVGGASTAMWPRSYRLVSTQLWRISAGEPLVNVVQGPSSPP
jgi:phosphoglycerate dehydrogenase-like enzyme